MDDRDRARAVQQRTAYDLEPIFADAPPAPPASPAEERLRRLMPLRLVTSGAVPEFCSYRSKRGKRCDDLARWRERDGPRGYCDRHRASVGLDDPTA